MVWKYTREIKRNRQTKIKAEFGFEQLFKG
jgi:hypothetical protein